MDKIQNAVVRASSSVIDPTLLIDYVKSEHAQMNMGLARGFSTLRLEQWTAVLNFFVLARESELTVEDWKALEVLRIMRTVMTINFSVDFVAVTKDEMLWDQHLHDFVAIVEHARRFIELEKEAGENVPVFTIETEIILPLYFVAAKCRDGRLRREAIALLKARERQEGIWNSTLTARLAERLVQMEEDDLENNDGCCQMKDVKWERRVQGVQVKWDLERRVVRLTYQCVDKENGGLGVVEVRGAVPRE